MKSKLITNCLINSKRKTPFSTGFRFVPLSSILLAAVVFLFLACDTSEQVSQAIVQSEENTTQRLPEGQGLAIGALAPEFSLPDAKGNTHRLSDYSGQKRVIVFYRTGT